MVPSTARVVIIGGGVHGASLLWHLAREGWTEHDEPGTELSVLILGNERAATVLGEPVFDPANETLRA